MTEKEVIQFQEEEIDLKGVLQKYLRYWYLFVAGVLLCLAAAYFYLRYSTPEYSISSTLLIKDDKKGPDLAGSTVFADLDLFQSSKNINNEIQVLKSKSLMQRVLMDMGLYTSYYSEGRIKSGELYGEGLPIKVLINKLDSTAFNKTVLLHIRDNNLFELEEEDLNKLSRHRFGQEVRKPYGTFTVLAASDMSERKGRTIRIKFHDIRKLAAYYNGQLNVAPVNKESSVLSISLVHPVPDKGKDIIDKLIEAYNKEAVEDKNQIAANTIEFIDGRLRFLTTELGEVEKSVEEYKQRNALTDVSSEAKQYLERASEYNRQLAEYEIQLDILNSIETYLNKQDSSNYSLVPSTLGLQDPVLLGLITRFNELQLERERLINTNQPNSPLVLNITDQLGNLRVNILENLRNIRSGLQITLNNLRATSSRFESRIQRVPSIERELLEINRQQGIKEAIYLYLLQKREEAALSLAASVSNSRIIDPAMAGDLPVKPKRQLVYLLALLVGLGIPFAFIYVKEELNTKVQVRRDVEKATAVPILGEIAHKQIGDTLVVTRESRSPVAELFRLMRANLQFSSLGQEHQLILVTSSISGEGKTFFSINLGVSLALSGKRVVLVDFDLRKPSITKDLDLKNELGITNYLITPKLSLEEIIVPTTISPDLFVIGAGPIPPNPAELMLLPRIGELMVALKQRFDYIIIDTSPVGQVADSLSLAPFIDSSLYLIRYQYTQKEQLKIVDDIYRNKKLRHTMLVLNDARKGNGYGYGYGYGQEKKKIDWKNWVKKKYHFE